jgi:hypothetical protein
MSRESATSLYRRSLLPADRANLPVASLVDCLPPALALRNRQGLQERGSSSGSSSSRAFQKKKDVTRARTQLRCKAGRVSGGGSSCGVLGQLLAVCLNLSKAGGGGGSTAAAGQAVGAAAPANPAQPADLAEGSGANLVQDTQSAQHAKPSPLNAELTST